MKIRSTFPKKAAAAKAGLNEQERIVRLFAQGNHAEALALAEDLTTRYPRDGFGWKALGVVLSNMGHMKDALPAARRAIALLPNDAEALSNLGCVLEGLGRSKEALGYCRRAVELNPDYAQAHLHLGNTLSALGQVERAIQSYENALARKPDFPEAHYNQGLALIRRSRLKDAIANFRRCLELQPFNADCFSNFLFHLNHDPDVSPDIVAAEHFRFGNLHESRLRALWPKHCNTPIPDRRLNIGFVSADLNNHAIANFIEPIFAHLAKSPSLSVFIYSNNFTEDEVTKRFMEYLLNWRQVAQLSDEELAKLIQADGIDILIDLSGHTAGNRLLAFARKPAPIQVSWMGFPGTTGLTSIDYYFSDRYFTPPDMFDDRFTEKLILLPAGAPFCPPQSSPPVNSLPALENGVVTFGSFNRLTKINQTTIALWSRLLHALSDSRMVVGGIPDDVELASVTQWFALEGIARDRLSLYRRDTMENYLAQHHMVDVCLDTYPYNGGTTTLLALWMGVPTLTLTGPFVASRSGATLLSHVGLEAFIANSPEALVSKGVNCSRNLQILSTIRQELRSCVRQSVLCQPGLVATTVEHALRIIWHRWCAGLEPATFELTL